MYLYYFFFTHPSLLGHLGPQLSFGEQCSGILSTAQLLWDRLYSPVLGNSALGSTPQLLIVVQYSGCHPTAQLWGTVILGTLMILVLV